MIFQALNTEVPRSAQFLAGIPTNTCPASAMSPSKPRRAEVVRSASGDLGSRGAPAPMRHPSRDGNDQQNGGG